MFEELKCPKLDIFTGKWFVSLKDEGGYLTIACAILHDSALKRNTLNQVYFHTEHAAHVAAAAYYLTNYPGDTTYPYSMEWDICIAEIEPEVTTQSTDTESTVMEFI